MAETQTQFPPLLITAFKGQNSALNVADLPVDSQALAKNVIMREIGTAGKRDGSAPVTSVALGSDIKHLTRYPFRHDIPVGAAPTLSAVAGANTLPSDTYYVRYTYLTTEGETEASAESSQAIVLGETLRVVVPALPLHATSINIYIANTTNSELLELNTTSLSNDFIEPLVGTGVAYPNTNTTTLRNDILASSGTSLYSYFDGELNELTMTNNLASADIYDIDFTNSLLTEVKLIADGGILKRCDSATVVDVTPAADASLPAPANALAAINAKGIKYIWEHNNYVFVSPGTNEVFFSNLYEFDYFPETYYELLVRKGDYVNGPGLSFDDVMFVPMRSGWNIWTGATWDNFDATGYLNTNQGVIAPRSIDKVNYPTGFQTILYLSEDGVNEIFTTTLDTQGRQYATRNIMLNKIDFESYGFTNAEKEVAISKYISKWNMYLLEITRDSTTYVFGFDTRDQEWRVWYNLTINTFLENEGVIYFAGNGFLKKFDENLYTDWTDFAQTTGDPVDFDMYSGLLSFGFDGHAAYLDYYLVEAKQWMVVSTLDVYITYGAGLLSSLSALKTQIFIWGVTAWSEAQWANTNYTDIVNNSKRIIIKKKGNYFQRRLRNNRNEPVLVYKESFLGRLSNK